MKKMFICSLKPNPATKTAGLSYVIWLGLPECDCAANG